MHHVKLHVTYYGIEDAAALADNIGMSKNWLDPFLKAAKISQEKLGDELDLSRATINRLANDHTQLKLERAEKMAPLLRCSAEDLMLNRPPKKAPLVSSFDEFEQPRDEIDPDWSGETASNHSGGLQFIGKIRGSSPEFPAAAGAGQGHVIDDRAARVVTNGIATGHPVTNEWVIPPDFVRHNLGATPSQIALIPVVGHSMEPRLFEGDRVMVDLTQSTYLGDAVYVIDDGDEVMKVKTIQKMLGTNPPRFRIVSEAAPDRFDELDYDQFRFIGRVVGRFTRM